MEKPVLTARPWDLAPAIKADVGESAPLDPDNAGGESVLEVDKRTPVNPRDFAPGGKYRSIVKVQLGFQRPGSSEVRWAMGTGWLVADDLLVTAGHCVFSHTRRQGRVKQIVAYIGYTGKDSIHSPNVQVRYGVRAVTTDGWLASPNNRSNDVGFVKLNKPFTGVKPFKFENTPTEGSAVIGVVGYPGDKTNLKTEEKGYHMYEEFAKVRWNLKNGTPKNMLRYRISTYPGQSGSPVIKQGTNISIGVHVYGAGEDKANGATVIGLPLGNQFQVYINSLNSKTKPLLPKPLPTKPIPGKLKSGPQNPNESDNFHEPHIIDEDDQADEVVEDETDELSDESFQQTIDKVIKVGGPLAGLLKGKVTPFLGPAGKATSALAYISLGIAGNIANKLRNKKPFESEGEEAEEDESSLNQGLISRAIVAGAAKHAVFEMDNDRFEELGIMEKIKINYKPFKPAVVGFPHRLLNPLMESALRISIENQAKVAKGEPKLSVERRPLVKPQSIFDETDDESETDPSELSPEAAFEAALFTPTPVLEGEEEFFPFIAPVIGAAISHGPKIISLINGIRHLRNKKNNESQFEQFESDEAAEDLEALAESALFSEAALGALLSGPTAELAPEGFFDSLKTNIQRIGPFVKRHAPTIIKVVKAGAKAYLESEGADDDEAGDDPKEGAADENGAEGEGDEESSSFLQLPTRPGKTVLDKLIENGGVLNGHANSVNGTASKRLPKVEVLGLKADDKGRPARVVRSNEVGEKKPKKSRSRDPVDDNQDLPPPSDSPPFNDIFG